MRAGGSGRESPAGLHRQSFGPDSRVRRALRAGRGARTGGQGHLLPRIHRPPAEARAAPGGADRVARARALHQLRHRSRHDGPSRRARLHRAAACGQAGGWIPRHGRRSDGHRPSRPGAAPSRRRPRRGGDPRAPRRRDRGAAGRAGAGIGRHDPDGRRLSSHDARGDAAARHPAGVRRGREPPCLLRRRGGALRHRTRHVLPRQADRGRAPARRLRREGGHHGTATIPPTGRPRCLIPAATTPTR